jgi:hypothetical protein
MKFMTAVKFHVQNLAKGNGDLYVRKLLIFAIVTFNCGEK